MGNSYAGCTRGLIYIAGDVPASHNYKLHIALRGLYSGGHYA